MTLVIAETRFMANNEGVSMGALVWSVCGVEMKLLSGRLLLPLSFLWLRPYLDPTNTVKPSVTPEFRSPLEQKDSGFAV
jgi:hypothetical protein